MNQGARHFKIGVFVIAGTFLLFGSLIALGIGDFLRTPVKMITVLDESVQGLDVGSPVKYRGVQIGEVSRITTVARALDWKPEDPRFFTFGRMVCVKANLWSEAWLGGKPPSQARPVLEELVKKGMRVRLAPQGVTGLAFLEVDYVDPESNPAPEVDWNMPKDAYYVPSSRSTFTRLSDLFNTVYRAMQGVDVAQLARNVEETMSSINRVATDDLKPAIQSITRAADTLQDIAHRDLRPALKTLNAGVGEVPETMRRTQRTLQRADDVLRGGQTNMRAALEDLRLATADLRAITGNARRYPSQTLFGEAPPPARKGR